MFMNIFRNRMNKSISRVRILVVFLDVHMLHKISESLVNKNCIIGLQVT